MNKIDNFSFDELGNKFFVFVTGGESTGKTSLVKEILNYCHDYEVIYFLTSKIDDYEYSSYVNSVVKHTDQINIKLLQQIVNDRRRKLVVMDDTIDCLYNLVLASENEVYSLINNIIDNSSVITCSKYSLFPEIAKNIDYIFIKDDESDIVYRYYDKNIFKSTMNFLITHKNIINNNMTMVLDCANSKCYKYESDVVIIDCILCTEIPSKLVI